MQELLDGWGLTVAIFVPVAAGAVMMLVPRAQETAHKAIALGATLAVAAVGVLLLVYFDYNAGGEFQFVADESWIDVIGSRCLRRCDLRRRFPGADGRSEGANDNHRSALQFADRGTCLGPGTPQA